MMVDFKFDGKSSSLMLVGLRHMVLPESALLNSTLGKLWSQRHSNII